jgi:hypothetical protein
MRRRVSRVPRGPRVGVRVELGDYKVVPDLPKASPGHYRLRNTDLCVIQTAENGTGFIWQILCESDGATQFLVGYIFDHALTGSFRST